jgi:hypothetical protein
LAASLSLAGCVTDGPGKPSVGPPPSNAKPASMFMAAQAFRDTNGDGNLDAGLVTVYIFAGNYARSLQLPGTFQFKIVGKGGVVIREWTLTAPGPDVASVNAGVGPGYVISLSLLKDGGQEKYPWQSVDILGSFTDSKGNAVSATPTSVQIGHATP